MEAIPCLGVLTMVRDDLLIRLIESIDYPIDKLVIFFQGSYCPKKCERIHDAIPPLLVRSVLFVESDINIGVARGWNWFLKNIPSSYWLIAGDDNFFVPSTLEQIATTMRDNSEAQQSVFMGMFMRRFTDVANDEEEVIKAGFNAYVVTRRLIEKVGMFDENIYPAYFEDNDLWHRILLSGETTGFFPESCQIVSGDAAHTGSCTLNSVPPDYREKMDQCYLRNQTYFHIKWGLPPNHYTHPFGRQDCSWNQSLFHENYHKNQDILLGHHRKAVIKLHSCKSD
jgi:hypothetical protein